MTITMMIEAYISPIQLAEILDCPPHWVRDILRANYWDDAPGKGGRWRIDHEMALKVAGVVASWRANTIDHVFSR
jgi:hypothetical protein